MFEQLLEHIKNAVNEATTGSMIAFVPGGFASKSNVFRALAQKQEDWDITIHEKPNGKHVQLKGGPTIKVAKDDWGSFKKEVLGGGKTFKKLNLKKYK